MLGGVKVPSPVAVVGAGFLGARVARALAQAGTSVVATSRRPANAQTLGPGIDTRALDISNDSPQRLRDQLADAGAVVLAYSSGGKQDRRRLFIDGGRRIMEACAGLGPGLTRVVYTSSTSALPERDAVLDEQCEEWPESERGRIQREAETMVGEVLGAAGIPWIVLRLAGLYGPGRDLGRIYRVHGRVHGRVHSDDPSRVLPGDGMRPTNLIHVDDAVSAVLAALAQPASTTGIIHVCDDEHTPRREMYARVAAAMGAPAPVWAQEAAPDAQPAGKRVDNTKMKRILGVELAHPAHALQVSAEPGSPSG